MSATPRAAAPSPRALSGLEGGEDAHSTAGHPVLSTSIGTVVIVAAIDKAAARPATSYQSVRGDDATERDVLTADRQFVAVLAPSTTTATEFLATQPPGAYVLALDDDASLTVHIKFRRATRSSVVVKAKELRKPRGVLKWDMRPASQGASRARAIPPTHRLHLSADVYLYLERCWRVFLPQVQAILFGLCCESHLDETRTVENCTEVLSASILALLSHTTSIGFYLIDGRTSSHEAGATALPVRHVDFDFHKLTVTVADGTFTPGALLKHTHFASRRMLDATTLTFEIIRDSFQYPDRVTLKEATSITAVVALSGFQNYIELGSADPEAQLLEAMVTACAEVSPLNTVPESLLNAMDALYRHFGAAQYDFPTRMDEHSNKYLWTKDKLQLGAQILPMLVELLIAGALTCDSCCNESLVSCTEGDSMRQAGASIIVRFVKAIRFVILVMTNRCDDAVVTRLVFQMIQLFSLRDAVPPELVVLVRDLCHVNVVFLKLLAKSHGTKLLWKAVRSRDRIHPKGPPAVTAHAGVPMLSKEKRKPSSVRALFLEVRKAGIFSVNRIAISHNKQLVQDPRNSVSSSGPPSTKCFVFFRLDPHAVTSALAVRPGDRHFSASISFFGKVPTRFCYCHRLTTVNIANMADCCCGERTVHCSNEDISPVPEELVFNTAATFMFEVILQLGHLLLMRDYGVGSWDREVFMLTRCEKLFDGLAHELLDASLCITQLQPQNDKQIRVCECRRFVVIDCISVLFRLEKRRRHQMAVVIGDKRYLQFIEAMQNQLRELNQSLSSNAISNEASCSVLIAHAVAFRWISRDLLEEWVMLSLGDLLHTADVLLELLQRQQHNTQWVAKRIGEWIDIFRVALERISDSDLQTLLLQVLDRGVAAMVPLISRALEASGIGDYATEFRILGFLNAFAVMDINLPVRDLWFRINVPNASSETMNEDDEDIEQRKAALLQRYLVFTQEQEVSTGDFIVRFVFPPTSTSVMPSSGGSCDAVVSFQDITGLKGLRSPTLLLSNAASYATYCFRAIEMSLVLERTLFTSLVPEYCTDINVTHAVLRQMHHFNECCRLLEDSSCSRDERYRLLRVVELHLDCLIVLANRRSSIPAVQKALNENDALSEVVKYLPWGRERRKTSGLVNPLPSSTNNLKVDAVQRPLSSELPARPIGSFSAASGQAPELFRLRLDKLQDTTGNGSLRKLPIPLLDRNHVVESVLMRDSNLHSLAVLFLISYIVVEPTCELDDAFCARFMQDPDDYKRDDHAGLLSLLQHHLATVEIDQRCVERALFNMETTQACVSMSRVSAIRQVLRLLSPNSFDRELYTTQVFDEEDRTGDSSSRMDGVSKPSREYIARGATSTVYRSTPSLPHPASIAIKMLDQVRDGDRSAVGSVYNEIAVLKQLRGERASLQLIDFGNREDENCFEIVSEWCPCTLAEWRSSFACVGATATEDDQEDGGLVVPFRTCLLMILRCFRKACVCLARIHARGVCHFDVKSTNVFLRTTRADFSLRLLQYGERDEDEGDTSSLRSCLCYGDFGEAMIADPAPIEVPSNAPPSPSRIRVPARSFLLSRTRGTEAIKSPEVFAIRGNEASKTRVTLASDVWSTGCLLYELVTQELLFQNDDWAALYAHLLVAPGDNAVLRPDHERKIRESLMPSTEPEERIVAQVVSLCAFILVRAPPLRPTLGAIARRVGALVDEVLKLPVTPDEKEVMTRLAHSRPHHSNTEADEGGDAQSEHLKSFAHAQLGVSWKQRTIVRQDEVDRGINGERDIASLVAPRLFWNFFLGAVRMAGSEDHTGGVDMAACADLETRHEHEFAHFVYFCWAPGDGDAGDRDQIFTRIVEDPRRSVFFVSRRHHSASSSDHEAASRSLELLVRQAPVYFPVLQRRLRREAGRVLFLCVGSSADQQPLEDVRSRALLFFLERAVGLAPLDALAAFARDAAPVVAYPKRAFAWRLAEWTRQRALALRHLADHERRSHPTDPRHVVACLCGASVWAMSKEALRLAIAGQRCSCHSSGSGGHRCSSFHPFPVPDRGHKDAEDEQEDDEYPIDSALVHDVWEEQLVLPMEAAAKRREPVAWVVLGRGAVFRLASLLEWKAPSTATRSTATAAVRSAASRRGSVSLAAEAALGAIKKVVKEFAESPRGPPTPAVPPPVPPIEQLLDGLCERAGRLGSRRSRPAAGSGFAAGWTLFECALCRLPMCAVFPDRPSQLALPLVTLRHSHDEPSH